MDKSMIKGVVIGGAVVTAPAGGMTGYKAMSKPVFAEVLAAKEVKETIKTPREECEDVPVTKKGPGQDEHRIAGTAIGVVAGGLPAAPSVPARARPWRRWRARPRAAMPAIVCRRTCRTRMSKRLPSVVARRFYDTSVKHHGYDVTYRLNGKEDVVRMNHNPGTQIPVKDGKLVPDPPAKS